MKAIQVSEWGGPEMVALVDAPKPQPGPGEVLIEVKAAGINPVDWKFREGWLKDNFPVAPPLIMGGEIAGTVAVLGEGVSGWAVGDEVHGATGLIGAFAEFVVISSELIARKPSNLSFEQAAALPIAVVTAVAALEAGETGPGSRVLIHAAAGGVGSIAVQIAKVKGAHVTALASSGNMDYVKSLGADEVIDRSTDYEQGLKDFDMVLDAYGVEAQDRSWGALKPGGIMVSLVAPPSEEQTKAHKVRGTMVFGTPNGSVLAEIGRSVESGDIKVEIAKVYPMAQTTAALAQVQEGQVRGKVVIAIPG